MLSCRLCGGVFSRQWSVRDAKSSQGLNMALCGQCGLVQQSTLPSAHDLQIYYSHHYREDYKSVHQPKLKYVDRAGAAAQSRLQFMQRAGISTQGQLLDIGAGGGEFCYLAGKAGFQAEGVEPHHGYSEFARHAYGVKVKTRHIEQLQGSHTDVITLFHVLEHLVDPNRAMQKMWSLLEPGGHLVVEVPNIHQADASPHNIYFKAHLFYYSRHSLVTAASQYFEPVYIEDKGNLFAAFRRRDVPLPSLLLPSPEQVRQTEQRLDQKGWMEYLFAGGGLLKPASRVARMLRERRLNSVSPRMVLDQSTVQPTHSLGWVGGGAALIVSLVVLEACA